jgi:hypothetical protein
MLLVLQTLVESARGNWKRLLHKKWPFVISLFGTKNFRDDKRKPNEQRLRTTSG